MLLAQIKSISGMGWEELRAEVLRKRDFAFVEDGEVKAGEMG